MLFRFSIVKTLLLIILCKISLLVEAQTGPGGVGNSTSNKVWLKADEAIIDPTPNARLGYWADQSGNSFNATQNLTLNQPTYQINGLNSKPYIQFDRSSAIQYLQLTASGVGALVSNSNTIFIVGKANTGGADNNTNSYQSFLIIPGYHSGVAAFGHPETVSVYMTNWLGSSVPGTPPTSALSNTTAITQGTWNFYTRRMTENISGTTESGFLNGSLINAVSHTFQMTNYTQNIVRIGTGFTSGSYTWALNGAISEIIIYNKSLNEAERTIVENYLSSKYGKAISNDKYSYDATNEFPYQVAGIGREDALNVHESANSGLMNINNPSLADGSYALLGHNGQPLALANSDAPIGMKRLDRTWRIDLTGDPGAVSVSFNVNNFSLSAGQSFQLLVDNDGQFSNATAYAGTISNGVFTVNVPVSLSDGDYMTLGYNQAGPSAPVSLDYDPNQTILIYGSSFSTAQPSIGDGGAAPSFSLINPPTGVSINTTTGVISVNTTATGTYPLTVSATNSYGSSVFNNAYALIIYPYVGSNFRYPSKTVSLGNTVEPTFPNLPLNAFQYSVIGGSLNGLNLDSSTGAVSGTLQSEGTIWANVRATPQSPNATGSPITTVINFSALGATGPGGVGSMSSNKIWLDTEYQTGLSNGARVTTFQDRSGNGWHAVQNTTGRKPTYLLNQLNGKPIIRFDRSSTIQCMELTASGIGGVMSNSNTMFVIGKANTGALDNITNWCQSLIATPGYHSSIAFSGHPTTTGTFIINYVGGIIPNSPTSTYVSNSTTLTQGNWQLLSRKISESGNTIQTSFLNGGQIGNPSVSNLQMTTYNINMVRIGSALLSGQYSWPLNGDIAEIIVYNTDLNEAQRIITENYLSAKYALSISNDKYSSNDAAYISDVEGIGTTDGSNSNKHSAAFNSKGLLLTEANASLNEANEFLFAGHASADNAIITTDLPVSVQERWRRVWYLEKTGSLDAKLSFDISDAGLTAPPNLANEFNYYQLLYRNAISGSFTVVPVIPTLENNDQLSFTLTNAQLVNGYYTLGYSQGLVWTGAQDQQWNQPANWSLNRIPTSGDQVIVNACATCPRLNSTVTVAILQLNNGSTLFLDNHVLTVEGATYLNGANVESNQGRLKAEDFAEVKNSVFKGNITIEKTGGSVNSCYGGNTFSPELKLINSSSSGWQVATQASNVIQAP